MLAAFLAENMLDLDRYHLPLKLFFSRICISTKFHKCNKRFQVYFLGAILRFNIFNYFFNVLKTFLSVY